MEFSLPQDNLNGESIADCFLTLPDGTAVGWRAMDENAALALKDFAASCNLLTGPVSGAKVCRVFTITCKEDAEKYPVTQYGCLTRINENSTIDTLICDWKKTRIQLHGCAMRNLHFAGLLPLLRQGNAWLIHGVLAARGEDGYIIGGPSGIGKSTTARRLGDKFKVLCDDCMLMTKVDGKFWACGTPTWSTWIEGKDSPLVDSRRFVELKKYYLLERGEYAVLPLEKFEALPGLGSSFTDILRWRAAGYPMQIIKALAEHALAGASMLTRTLSGARFRLKLEDTVVGDLL